MNFVLRLEFENVFPDENRKDILEYLKVISPKTLLSVIGFSNTTPQPNYDNIHSNFEIRHDIISRVNFYCQKNNIGIKPCVVSREASLKLAEIILENRVNLIDNSTVSKLDIDLEETNLLKAFLIINKEVNLKTKFSISEEDNIENIAEMIITMSFSVADIGLFEDNDIEFGKLILGTLTRFELLVSFLKSKEEYKYLEESLYRYFSLDSIDELVKEVKILFFELLDMKTLNKGYVFNVKNKKSLAFLNSLVSENIIKDDDFTSIRNHPIYRISDQKFSVIDYFFVVDKFYKSIRFVLKDSYNKEHDLSTNSRKFFDFFNTKFSEEYLMKKILDRIFSKKYLVKKVAKETSDNEPDYYIRHLNKIFLFENKDVLIAKAIKSSGNIETILDAFKQKFFESNGKPIGIGQLVTSVKQIVENNFKFDDYVNNKNNLTIYPILLVSDRIFEIPGINYILNKWYLSKIKAELKEKYNPVFIKNLTLIDIDTLIYWIEHLENNESNLKKIIDKHLSKMNCYKKANGSSYSEIRKSVEKNALEQLSPISYRLPNFKFPKKMFIEKFEEVIEK
jgi:hypothetical protein